MFRNVVSMVMTRRIDFSVVMSNGYSGIISQTKRE